MEEEVGVVEEDGVDEEVEVDEVGVDEEVEVDEVGVDEEVEVDEVGVDEEVEVDDFGAVLKSEIATTARRRDMDCPFPKKSAVSTDAAPASSSNGAGSSVSSSTVASVAEQFKAMVMASSAPSPEAISAIRSAYEDELLQDEDEDEEMDFVFCA
ncbi:hypothetical protein Fcan01_04413 [Folsomia candida]|uniref:Uncharacterized protein n=1 Tax=Folsomia candida TaxID=158441 RepID=A0A226EU38_FOLCA|nr:hypothetical protein Fcan01_04413 [Folsomia candida]